MSITRIKTLTLITRIKNSANYTLLLGSRLEAQHHNVLTSRCEELWQTRVATARAVAYTTLPEVEVSEHLRLAYKVVRMLATIEHVVVELGVVDMRE